MKSKNQQRFKQRSKLPVAIGFAGLVALSQLMVINMGYSVPTYFWLPLVILSGVIIWSMVSEDIIVEDDRLVIMSGPFKNLIPFESLNQIIDKEGSGFQKRRNAHLVIVKYGKNKKINLHPQDKNAFIKVLRQKLPQLKIDHVSS